MKQIQFLCFSYTYFGLIDLFESSNTKSGKNFGYDIERNFENIRRLNDNPNKTMTPFYKLSVTCFYPLQVGSWG